MRNLSVVDDSSVNLSASVEARIAYTKARKCLYLARCYTGAAGGKGGWGEALVLVRKGVLHLREVRLLMDEYGNENVEEESWYPLTPTHVSSLESQLAQDTEKYKRDWFGFNGGAPITSEEGRLKHEKPLFFNIAWNFINVDMERLEERAGKVSTVPTDSTKQTSSSSSSVPNAKLEESKRDVEEALQEELQPAKPATKGLSSLLGGWWGRS